MPVIAQMRASPFQAHRGGIGVRRTHQEIGPPLVVAADAFPLWAAVCCDPVMAGRVALGECFTERSRQDDGQGGWQRRLYACCCLDGEWRLCRVLGGSWRFLVHLLVALLREERRQMGLQRGTRLEGKAGGEGIE